MLIKFPTLLDMIPSNQEEAEVFVGAGSLIGKLRYGIFEKG